MGSIPKVGDMAPDFALEGTAGQFRLSDHRGSAVILLFYPGDNTPVCTRQFCSYRDRADEFDGLDAVVVGISGQSLDSHEAFASDHDLSVPLLADEDKSVATAYGVAAPVMGTRRAAIVVGPDGRIAHRKVHLFGLSYATVDELRDALDGVTAQTTHG